jgi:hypothetical protein
MDIRALQKDIEFDKALKERALLKKTKGAAEKYKFSKTYLNPIKYVLLVVYYIVVPFLQTPDWCVRALKE